MFGKKIAALRKEMGLSQYELADRLGFSRGKLANYEQGTREPDYETLKKIADFFEVTTDYLLNRTKNPSVIKDKEASYNIDDLDLQIAFKEASDFSEEARKQAIDFINYLKEKEGKEKTKGKGK
ncbi:helix-turn-helix domain-containing protein [Bacillus haynesii]|uniref:helix-turn-helix domain-containing protein n=1 Tax=Bacillus haynesii TaxID=1925021 RepID=UPI0022814A7E|nr:helix-turn-helix transcriptional regulator [Bacillus haynesii]MCY8574082.1 helix-turn-helix domain-containing protein [Bacillus haynesii]MCY8595146.1 helix-turn-helix domain-containing protein [Bacillus haynesii]MCY8612595.1 helix-turn-helix domain-containing protein [Bacillus haynesii]